MSNEVIELGGEKKSSFMNKVMEILPDGGNLNLCLTCGVCSAGCPATGVGDMDPRRFLHMAALGLDDELLKSDWVWMCTMCQMNLEAYQQKISRRCNEDLHITVLYLPQLIGLALGLAEQDLGLYLNLSITKRFRGMLHF
jgi:heterodisulfide reductase subunit C